MSTSIEKYKREKEYRKKGLVEIPVYSRVYMEGNKLIGELQCIEKKEVITVYKEG
ncbi:hypothetical protein [Halolactibacillus miurensis]|uniref:Uncharacterized protein n=1 Tax=Halolactibacillus miurensis TaxID=306541 RepID=A0A1I6S238_9BACI|nr:hypothetical protein [Halolactibacillus miurensis]SFS71035.1 hypothetical protein SAMN05421668_10793 [Halolactibacillus miurensis]